MNFSGVYSTRGSVWYGQEWHRNSSNEYYEARTDHEVCYPRGHGGYHRYLRAGRLSTDREQKYVKDI